MSINLSAHSRKSGKFDGNTLTWEQRDILQAHLVLCGWGPFRAQLMSPRHASGTDAASLMNPAATATESSALMYGVIHYDDDYALGWTVAGSRHVLHHDPAAVPLKTLCLPDTTWQTINHVTFLRCVENLMDSGVVSRIAHPLLSNLPQLKSLL